MKINFEKVTYEFSISREMIRRSYSPGILTTRLFESMETELEKILEAWEHNNFNVVDVEDIELTDVGKKTLEIINETICSEFPEYKFDDLLFEDIDIDAEEIDLEAIDEILDEDNKFDESDENSTFNEKDTENEFEEDDIKSLRDNYDYFCGMNKNNLLVGIAIYYVLERMKRHKTVNIILIYKDMLIYFLKSMFASFELMSLKEINDETMIAKNSYEKESNKKDKIIEEKKQQHMKDMKKIEELNKVIKSYEALKSTTQNNDFSKATKEIEQLKKELKELTENTVSKIKYIQLGDTYEELKLKHTSKSKENMELSDKLKKLEEWDLLNELNKYLIKNGLTEEMMLLLHPYLDDYKKNIIPVKSYSDDREERLIGYCVIKDQDHYFTSGSSDLFKIYNIPESSYISEGQFILVNQDHCFIHSLDNVYEDSDDKNFFKKFETVNFDHEGHLIGISNPKSYNLLKNQVVAVNASLEVIHVYKKNKFNADTALKSALVRGQKVYFIIKNISGGYLARDIETHRDVFLNGILSKENIVDCSILFVYENRIVKYIDSPKFYTCSSCYKLKRWGFFEEKEGNCFVNLDNYERIKINNVSTQVRLEKGDYIAIDEFGNYIEKKFLVNDQLTSIEQKVREYNKESNESKPIHIHPEAEEPIEIMDYEIVIIGDASLETAYKYAFLKKGLVVTVVDGLDTWHKISKAANCADFIVFVTDYAKHSYYSKLKDEYEGKTIIYAESSGANRVLERVTEVIGIGAAS